MNSAAYTERPAVEALGPLTLNARDRFDGPWLAILETGTVNAEAIAENIVLVGDPRAPAMWRRIDADQPVQIGNFLKARPIALSEFGVRVTLYPHSRVLSVWKASLSRARRYAHPAGGIWAWEGPRCARIKLPRNLMPLVEIAVKDFNSQLRGVA